MPPVTKYKDYKVKRITRTSGGVTCVVAFYQGSYDAQGNYVREFVDSVATYQYLPDTTDAQIDSNLRVELSNKFKRNTSIPEQNV